jgi:hypothetical protein
MTAVVHDIDIEQGATFHMGYTRHLSDGVTPRDLTGLNVRMQVRLQVGDLGDPLVDITQDASADGQIVVSGPEGHLYFTIAAEATDRLDRSTAVYDVFLDVPGTPSEVEKLMKGDVTVDNAVTRPTHD